MHGTHDHHHDERPSSGRGRAFALATGLNVAFVVVELVYGALAGSVSLLADAVHNLGDVGGLLLAWGAAILARRRPTVSRTYGWRKATILAALANAMIIMATVGGVAWEAVGRLREPVVIQANVVLVVAAVGVVINGASAALFLRGRHSDVNVRGAFMHLVADAAVSLGVVGVGIILLFTDWTWIDPAASLLISAFILYGTWGLLQQSLNLALDAVPRHIDPVQVRAMLGSRPGVCAVHDFHVWAMGSDEVALTAHIVVDDPATGPELVASIARELEEHHGIGHATIQIEPSSGADTCTQAGPDRV